MSGPRRFFTEQAREGEMTLSGEEYNHAINVLRLKVGDEIVLSDNTGTDYPAKIVKIEKKSMTVSLSAGKRNECEPNTKITLCCGYLKGDKTELVVQKATELGVSDILLFESRFSSAYFSDNKMERLVRVAQEASKQCGRATVPNVSYAKFEDAIESLSSVKNKVFACEFESEKSIDLTNLSGDTAIVVGSEGGFSDEERAFAVDHGFCSVSLGKRILRAETADIALLSVVAYALGEWKV